MKNQFIKHTQKNKMEKRKVKTKKKEVELVRTECKDKDCPVHGYLKTRGRIFEGKIIKKSHKRITIEFERMIYVRKYERYAKSKTKIHARLPICMDKDISVGDLVRVQECRPLSKIIHSVFIGKINDLGEKEK